MNTQDLTVNKLRKELKAKVKIFHYRLNKNGEYIPNYQITNYDLISNTGGKTQAFINLNGKEVEGEAVCSRKDQYCRREGVRIALTRAYNKL